MRKQLNAAFELKEVDALTGRFKGRASVYGVVDFHNDVVIPGAFTNTLRQHGGRIRVLNQHNPSDPIGWATLTDEVDGLHADGQLEMRIQSGREMAIKLQSGLIDSMSIGYEVEDEKVVGGVRQLRAIKLWEISLVTFPANAEARVTDVKRQRDRDELRQLVTSMEILALKMSLESLNRSIRSLIRINTFYR